MDAKQIKTAISNLEKSQDDDASLLEILKTLDQGIKATEALLRETKVGIVVNKYRGSSNNEISSLVKSMVKKWKEDIKKSKLKSDGKTPNSTASQKNGTTTTTTSSSSSSSTTKSTTTTKSASTAGTAEKSLKPARVYEGKRSCKIDGVDYRIYEESIRNSMLDALYTGLAKENKTNGPNEIFGVAKEIETEVFGMSNHMTNDFYRSKLRTLVANIRSSNNPELRAKLLSRRLAANKFVKMSPEEMANENLRKEREQIEKENLFKAKSAVEKKAVTDRFQCGKCKQRKVSYYQMQTRSADEPLTTFCECVNCGNHWSFS
ncbi:transcription elongation factor [Saccharomycopsis crataegensis]|uniref:Transcription elongation factor n=1 Tax=Saccharomycopsis crataegensis TaxID=43959 RepID=A0AAV5QQ52_9ASCO|nr:transcription elongation factor [Saccharomycopsis crataegensis]